jgi:tetratricopeptide repeat protein 30
VFRYEQLTRQHPDNEDYKLHYAQSLYKVCNNTVVNHADAGVTPSRDAQAGLYQDAVKAAHKVSSKQKQVTMIEVACAYEQDDLQGTP